MKRVHQDFSRDLNLEQFKKPKHCTEVNNLGVDCSASESNETPPNVPIPSSDAIDFSDPCSVRKGLDSGRFGSVTKDIETLHAHKMLIMGLLSESLALFREGTSHVKQPSESWVERPSKPMGDVVVIDLEDESVADGTPTSALKAIVIDSDEEDKGVCSTEGSSLPLENALSDHQTGESILKDEEEVKDHLDGNVWVKETELSMEIHSEVEVNGDANLVEKHANKTPFIDDNNVHKEADSTIKKHEYVTVREHGDDRAFAEDTRLPVETGTETVREHENHRAFAEDTHLPVETGTETVREHGNHRAFAEDTRPPVETGTETVRGHEDDGAFTEDTCLPAESGTETKKNNSVYVRVEDEENLQLDSYDDGLEDAWNEMSMALELSKAVAADHSPNELQVRENEVTCEHYFILKDDLGYVCRICGVIDRGIETIFEFQYGKAKRSSRTYMKSGNSIDKKSNGIAGVNICDDDERPNEVYAHPRHSKKMKPHQKEGFDFLVSNLVGDDPGGCILAHAPGSGKTFMVISFVHSFLAKYPNARPLVVLPKGIVSTWKKEFQIWQIEDFPLYDTAKADGRVQQLEVLKQWVENKSILFLSYQQFSSIVCDADNNEVSTSCQDILLKVPSILVLDEGHTPRNDNTDIFQALAKVQTPRKVVLSGTLYQNHVQEVFNILNLVQTNFLKSETARAIVTRIRSKVDMSLSSARKRFKASSDAAFFEIVEDTLQKDKDSRRKASIIHDLRELTHKVLHYYKGDFLDELPGLVDFTVVLNLSSKQMSEVEKVKKLRANFQANYLGSAIYLHPMLLSCSDKGFATDDKMDELLQNLNLTEGVKAKFFLNMLSLCEAKKEKLLVFSQYLVPLKFLERLAMKEKGWSLGKEIFVISGKSSSDARELSMDRFNNSPVAKVFFGSIKACGEGISLVGASRILIMDIHLNPSVTRQAIGRAFRPGQTRKVYVYRLVAADSPEVEDYATCSKKELIAKTWFESKANSICKDFEVETLDIKDCGDEFLEGNPVLEKDIKVLYRR